MKQHNEHNKHAFTAAQFHALNEEERQVVLAVAEYLTSSMIDISDEQLSEALNLMKPAEGCVPNEEVDEELLHTVRRKFAAVYQTALDLAQVELKQHGFEPRKHFNFSLVIEPSYEGSTQVAIVDYDRPICYLYEWSKAWHYNFTNLAELAGAVLSAKVVLVRKVTEFNPKEIMLVLEHDRVPGGPNLPPDQKVVIVDYDIEDAQGRAIKARPLDRQPCKLRRSSST